VSAKPPSPPPDPLAAVITDKRPGFLRVGLTPGCPAGVGPEVVAHAAATASLPKTARLTFFGSPALLLRGAHAMGVPAKKESADTVLLMHPDEEQRGPPRRVVCTVDDGACRGRRVTPGHPDADALSAQRDALHHAALAAQRGDLGALVTGPIRKAALVTANGSFPGQTEFLHHHLKCDDAPPLMAFVGGPFVLGLATVHVPLAGVADALTAAVLANAVRRLASVTAAWTGKKSPCLAVLGLNPHAGEGGLLGHEEQQVIEPTLAALRKEGLDLTGPLPADGFFAEVARSRSGQGTPKKGGVQGVLAMFHDQGLAPYKLLSAGSGVNVTWGLKVVRTSPDHGTADALAGRGLASPSSMRAAIEAAVRLRAAR
jgi:4-hydroxythreonine-4-phosphate dehydrogenase